MIIAEHRARVASWLAQPVFTNGILIVIAVNALVLGLQTSETVMSRFGGLLVLIDSVCLAIFVAEIVLKLFAHGRKFFHDGWNLFDFFVVGIAFAPSGESLTVLRAMRILRVLRAVSVSPTLRKVVAGLVAALPGMASVILLMMILFYIGGVMATTMFAATFPQWFGSLGASLYTLFQIMTLESWSMGIVRPVMETHPWAWAFFVPFICATSFAVINLLIGLIVNAMQEVAEEETQGAARSEREQLSHQLEDIGERLARIEAALGKPD